MEDKIDILEYAIKYAKMGLAIHPVNQKDKTPYLKAWQERATTDLSQIRTWWRTYPNAMIGCATGKKSGGICVIDIDRDDQKGVDGYESMRHFWREYGEFADSWQSITGRGGYHYFFKTSKEIKNRVGILDGVDIRGDGGYVVLPPSMHPNGNRYEWEYDPDETDLADANDTVNYLLNLKPDKPTSSFVAPAVIPEGQRNDMIFKSACSLQSKGFSDEAIMIAMQAENENKCIVPLDQEEVENIVLSVVNRYEKGKPIYVHDDGVAIQGQRDPIFDLTDKGKIKKTIQNICEAIEYDSELYGVLSLNELTGTPYIKRAVPWDKENYPRDWTNADDSNLRLYLENKYGFTQDKKINDALVIVSKRHQFHPIRERLSEIYKTADKNMCSGAIRKLLVEYMGCDDIDYNYEVMKIFMLGAITRVFHPGCKFDYTMILYGAQGFGKSEFLRRLAMCDDWFSDSFGSFEGDKAIEKIQGIWIIEMAELKALKREKDAEAFKAFLTSQSDYFRMPYDRRAEKHKRMCVFAGTTNDRNIFIDKTGNRRFLPIVAKKGNETKSLFENDEIVNKDFLLAWQEAMIMFYEAETKPRLVLSQEASIVAKYMQEDFSKDDHRIGIIKEWLETVDTDKVCAPIIMNQALGIEFSQIKPKEREEIVQIMDNMEGWERMRNKNKGRTRFGKDLGQQLTFIRSKT